MPGALSHPRKEAATAGRFRRYVGYAIGEVLLIFIGISLAVAFENSNADRRTKALEWDLLITIESNLALNVEELRQNIALDETLVAAVEISLAQLHADGEWPDSLNGTLGQAFFWSSPFLATSGYESLQQLGMHLVSDRGLRDALVHLHERTYAFLTGDTERAQWAFQEAVLYPVVTEDLEVPVNLEAEESRAGGPEQFTRSYRPRDGALRKPGRVETALAEHRRRMLDGIQWRLVAITETEDVAKAIRDVLESG
jgi:hypothetical protein